jgi:alpha-N-arabinofuranosidase
MGPYEIYPNNPILDQNDLPADRPNAVESVGHAKFVVTQTGEWWTVFLGARPYAPQFYNIGRETFLLPVSWVNDWPVLLEKGRPLPFQGRRPGLPAAERPSRPQSGDFGYLDDFDSGSLPLGWIGIRVPKQPTYRVDRGELVIAAHGGAIGDRTQSPGFVGRRQAHPIATVSTALRYSPGEDGARAGLLAVQSDDNYLFFGVQRLKGVRHVVLSARQGANDPKQGVTLASLPLPAQFEQAVQLRLSLNRGRASVDYALGKGRWKGIEDDLDVTFLSTKKAGGFVGTVIGLYSERG